MAKADANELYFLPLGGVGEIGMNLALYGVGSEDDCEWIIVDMGVSFAGPELPGVNLILPDIRFLENERHSIRGIVITHAHEDHYGGVLDLWPKLRIPVYCTAFTAGMLETKRDTMTDVNDIPINIFKPGDVFQIGPFSIEAVGVSHSIPEAVSLSITSPLGTVIHTGDWKIDTEPSLGSLTDEKRFKEIGNDGVLALICDSTNATRDGVSATEHEVALSLEEIIASSNGRVAITTFSSNIGRIRSIANAAHNAGRQVLLVGRSIKRCVSVADDLGYMEGIDPFLSEEDFPSIPRNKIVIILTGSQGEQRAALAKLSRDEMRTLNLTAGDTVIYSSRSIPGNERDIIDTQNRLIDLGVKVITDKDGLVHVSGHPRRNELQQMYRWVKPKILVPVHGEATHLKAQAALGAQSGIEIIAEVRNGDMLRLAPGRPEVVDEVPVGRIFKDGNLIGNEDELGINERRKLSFVGYVGVSLLVNTQNELAEKPQMIAYGLPEFDGQGVLLELTLSNAAEDALNNIPRARRKDDELIREACRRAIRSLTNTIWGKKPVVHVFLHRVKK